MTLHKKPLITGFLCSTLCSFTISPAQLSIASVYDDEEEQFYPYEARQLNDVDGYITRAENLEFSEYGGWKAKRAAATGFFRVEKIDGRWWIIDPQGYYYIHKAVNSVQLFGNFTPDNVYELLPGFGMNGTGNWSDFEVQNSNLKSETPLAYCPKFSFVSTYKRTRADRLPIAVFDDEFVTFCEEEAQQFAQYKNDPQVLGYFIDNELSWTFTGGLESHIDVNDPSDKNYQAAVAFLGSRDVGLNNFSDEDADDYAAIMAERYLSVVTKAVRAVDPNHMILGPRFNKSWNRTQEFMEAAGRYLDIVALNHYHRWGSRTNELENIAKWTDRPLLISEFYAMEKIPDFEETGAGWRVEDETSRALFYQHFLTAQLEKDFIVGFHWFNFQDDFKNDDNTEAQAKRGLIDIEGGAYPILQESMKYMNDRIYDYIEFIDGRTSPDVTIIAEADAYFQDGTNYGTDPELWAKTGNAKFDRSFCVRFDASAVTGNISSAKIQLFGTSPEEKLTGVYRAELVTDNSWSETSINALNRPPSTTLLAEWGHGDDLEIDVTEELLAALSADQKLSIRVYGILKNGLLLQYGSRENPDSYTHPKLVVHYDKSDLSSHTISSDNFEDGFGIWNSSGKDSILYSDGAYAHQGSNAALLRDDTSQSRLISNSIDLVEYTSVSVDFWYYSLNFDNGHDLWLQISTDDGGNYTTVKTWVAGTDFENDTFTKGSFTIDDQLLSSNTILRFKSDAANDFDMIHLDEINVTASGRAASSNYASWTSNHSGVLNEGTLGDSDNDGIENILEYVLGADPGQSDTSHIPAARFANNKFAFSFDRNADSAQEIDQTFQYSTDLETWTDVKITEPKSSMVNLTAPVEGTQNVEVVIESDSESVKSMFGRLKVDASR